MTNHNDAIERALERYMNGEDVNQIFKDLAAEIEQRTVEALRPLVATADDHAARLAAVVEYAKECRAKKEPVDQMHVIALARGEGGEQAATTASAIREGDSQEIAPLPATPGAHGNASRNDETKPQQSPASDEVLDEIVRDVATDLAMRGCIGSERVSVEVEGVIRAACIRARETDPRFNLGGRMNAIETGNLYTRMIDAERKLAAVRAWRDKFIEWGPGVSRGWLTKMERKLDAILDGKEAE